MLSLVWAHTCTHVYTLPCIHIIFCPVQPDILPLVGPAAPPESRLGSSPSVYLNKKKKIKLQLIDALLRVQTSLGKFSFCPPPTFTQTIDSRDFTDLGGRTFFNQSQSFQILGSSLFVGHEVNLS